MTNKTKSAHVVGQVADLAEGAVPAADVVRHVAAIVRDCAECVKTIEEQRTERARFDQHARVQIELIQSRREVVVRFMEQTFAERDQNFRELFRRLDVALERDTLDGARDVLAAIVDLAKSSPFEALQVAINDKNTVWEF